MQKEYIFQFNLDYVYYVQEKTDRKRGTILKKQDLTKPKEQCGVFTVECTDDKSEGFKLTIPSASIKNYLKYCMCCIYDNNQKFLHNSIKSFNPVSWNRDDIEGKIKTSLSKDGLLYNSIKQIISYSIKKRSNRSDYKTIINEEMFNCLHNYISNIYYTLSNETLSQKIKNYEDKNKSLDVLIKESNIDKNNNLNESTTDNKKYECQKKQDTCFTFNESHKYEEESKVKQDNIDIFDNGDDNIMNIVGEEYNELLDDKLIFNNFDNISTNNKQDEKHNNNELNFISNHDTFAKNQQNINDNLGYNDFDGDRQINNVNISMNIDNIFENENLNKK